MSSKISKNTGVAVKNRTKKSAVGSGNETKRRSANDSAQVQNREESVFVKLFPLFRHKHRDMLAGQTRKVAVKNSGKKSSQLKKSIKNSRSTKTAPRRSDSAPVFFSSILKKSLLLIFSFIFLLFAFYGAYKFFSGETFHDQIGRDEKIRTTLRRDNSSAKKTVQGETPLYVHNAKLYFFRYSPETEDVVLIGIKRRSLQGKVDIVMLLKSLLKGPSAQEKDLGFISALPENLQLNDIKYSMNQKELILDFNDTLEEGGGRNILQNRLRQIVYTMTQSPGVQGVRIWIDGQPKRFLSGDGIVLSELMQRSSI